jgi:hypothetical protein
MKARAHPHAPLTSFAAAELPASEKHHIEKITKIGVGSCGVGCTGKEYHDLAASRVSVTT